MNDLFQRKCVPCEGGVPAFSKKESEILLTQLKPDWQLGSDHKKISREFKFKNFIEALAFVNKIGEIAEQENHHPDIVLKWGYVQILLWTHSIDGLSENDFIIAAKIDQI